MQGTQSKIYVYSNTGTLCMIYSDVNYSDSIAAHVQCT